MNCGSRLFHSEVEMISQVFVLKLFVTISSATPGSESASLTYSESSHSPSPSLDGEISQVKDSLAALDESLTSSVLHLHDITGTKPCECVKNRLFDFSYS